MIISVLFFCLHKQPDTPVDTKQVSTKATQSNPKQPKANQSNPKQTMTTINTTFKVYIENMPDEFNTFKDINEYYKNFKKEYKEKVKAKKTENALSVRMPIRKKGFNKIGNPKNKRVPSPYNIFVKEKYAGVKAENPKLDNKEIFSEIAMRWQEMKIDECILCQFKILDAIQNDGIPSSDTDVPKNIESVE